MNNGKINQENIMNNKTSAIDFAMADVYLVELSERFSVVSCAPRARKLLVGSDASEILSFKVSHDLRKYLLAYGERPVVIPTLVGDALVLPQFFASSRTFALVFFKNSKPDALLRIAASERFSGRVEAFETSDLGRMSKWDEPLADRLDFVLNIAENIFNKSLISFIDDSKNITEKCNILFENISLFTGVSANVSVEDGVLADDCFDARLFNSFCISMLMLGKRYAKSDVADVRVFQKDLGLSVSISFASARKISRVKNPEVAHFNAISDANNMIFSSSFDGGRVEVSFTPARKDWSYLELKAPDCFIM